MTRACPGKWPGGRSDFAELISAHLGHCNVIAKGLCISPENINQTPNWVAEAGR